jgi:hypothetical protein
MPSPERFGLISEIRIEEPATWEDRLFVTLDVDWAHDGVVAYAAGLLEEAEVPATWFVTHDSPAVERLRANPRFELGIHPNFNFLIDAGDPRNGASAEEVVDRLLSVVPEAKSVRSHAMTQSSNLMALFSRKGLTHDSNHFVPEQSGIMLRPWWHWCDILKIPYFWEDDVRCLSPVNTPLAELVERPGLKVFDFHPIHLFLNTEAMDRYEAARPDFGAPERLLARRFDGRGTQSLLAELISLGSAAKDGVLR